VKVVRASAWAEAVFHVLAHVEVPYAGSCFNPVYLAWVGAPPAQLRADVEVLRQLPRDVFERMQVVAWAFGSAEEARAAVDTELPYGLPAAEVLRAAAELELERVEALAPLDFSLDDALAAVLPAARGLATFEIGVVRALGVRGRVHGGSILVGPDGHPGWQAAHEATVAETGSETVALLLLGERAAAAGLAEAHARWLSTLDLSRT
jgi:hypothetical protein